MANDFDLNSQKWLALIFADRNKEYGAYVHREESSDRHLKATAIIMVIALSLIFLPGLVKSVLPEKVEIVQVTDITLSDLDALKNQELPEDNQIKQFEAPPPPDLKATVAFTPPVITKDENIRDDELIKTQQELTETKADISIMTIEGVEGGTVDIADVIEHKTIVEDQPQGPMLFSAVEVPPQFPGGGDAALLKWLSENITYPNIAAEQGIQGIVNIRFVITKDGSVDEVELIKGLEPSCDREAMNKVKKMPKWIPGRQNGQPVSVYYSLPVRFKLENSR